MAAEDQVPTTFLPPFPADTLQNSQRNFTYRKSKHVLKLNTGDNLLI